jgi:hypothetical protein
MRWAVLPPDKRSESRYPVASASLPRSGPGGGVHVEHPKAERHGPLPLGCYAAGADATGYLRSLSPNTRVQPLAIPELRPAGGACS